MASSFYGLGWIAKKIQLMERLRFLNKHKATSFVAVIIITLILIPLVFINGLVNMRTVTYGNYFLYIINAVVYSFLLAVISILIEALAGGKAISKFLEWVGRNTLVVLMLNSTCVRAYEVVFGGMLTRVEDVTVYRINAVVAVIITIVCVAASEFINRFCPWLVGKSRKC